MWHLKTITLPVVIGALGTVANSSLLCFTDPRSFVFNRTSKNNAQGHCTYPAKGAVNAIFL